MLVVLFTAAVVLWYMLYVRRHARTILLCRAGNSPFLLILFRGEVRPTTPGHPGTTICLYPVFRGHARGSAPFSMLEIRTSLSPRSGHAVRSKYALSP